MATNTPSKSPKPLNTNTVPTLHLYETGEMIRVASAAELAESIETSHHDGGAGVIKVNGKRCYVIGGSSS